MNTNSTTKVFIPHDKHVWVTGEILSAEKDGIVEVRIIDNDVPNQKININLEEYKWTSLPLQNDWTSAEFSNNGVDDMCSLSYLHEPSILDNLKRF